MVLAGEDLVTDPDNEAMDPIVEPLARVIRIGCDFLQDGFSARDEFSRRDDLVD